VDLAAFKEKMQSVQWQFGGAVIRRSVEKALSGEKDRGRSFEAGRLPRMMNIFIFTRNISLDV
jgi:hypothetical protein